MELHQIHNLVNWQGYLTVLQALREMGTITAIGATLYSAGAFDGLAAIM